MPGAEPTVPLDDPTVRLLNQAFRRAGGSPLRGGNRVRLLRDGAENYPAWLDAIASAQQSIHFESYIIHDDAIGRRFAEALSERARAGVRVRVLYDWWGARGMSSQLSWRSLRRAGVEVRCFNPPGLNGPFHWLQRDHRKAMAVDGRIAFVSGLCVGQAWLGDAANGVEPWRDTGVALEGPAVADVAQALEDTWAVTGRPGAAEPRLAAEPPAPAGDVAVRVVATTPGVAALYRLDQVIAAAAVRTLWLTDAYFIATTSFVSALRAAAGEGVDVRLLVPGATDIPGLRALSRAGYRPLLEGGIRVFEWNGPMLHAKTAVADRSWARVGSTNLNSVSWLGNWELDVLVQDQRFAGQMADRYLEDMARSTEVVLNARRHVEFVVPRPARRPRPRADGSAGRVTAGAISIGGTIGAAISTHRELGPAEGRLLVAGAILLLVLGLAVGYWPRIIAVPASLLSIWSAVSLLADAYRLHKRRGRTTRRVP